MANCKICGKKINAIDNTNGTLIGPECLYKVKLSETDDSSLIDISGYEVKKLNDLQLSKPEIGESYFLSAKKLEVKLRNSLKDRPENYNKFPVDRILKLHNNYYIPESNQEMLDALAVLPSKYLTHYMREMHYSERQLLVEGKPIDTKYEPEDED